MTSWEEIARVQTAHVHRYAYRLTGHRADAERALHLLSPERRAAVVLRDIVGLSYDDIATTAGVTRSTAASRILRGRQQLRAALSHRAPRPPRGHALAGRPPSHEASPS